MALIILIILIAFSSTAQPQPQPPGGSFTHYILAQQWPKSLCNVRGSNTCDPRWSTDLPTGFTIHGLWPYFHSRMIPRASGIPFDKSQIQPIADFMEKNWMNAVFKRDSHSNLSFKKQKEQANNRFWRHEWNHHGDYSGLDIHGYFETAKAAFEVRDPGWMYDAIINSGAIKRSRGGISTTVEFNLAQQAIQNELNAYVDIRCNYDHIGREQLYEVQYLVDKINLWVQSYHKSFTNCTAKYVTLPYA